MCCKLCGRLATCFIDNNWYASKQCPRPPFTQTVGLVLVHFKSHTQGVPTVDIAVYRMDAVPMHSEVHPKGRPNHQREAYLPFAQYLLFAISPCFFQRDFVTGHMFSFFGGKTAHGSFGRYLKRAQTQLPEPGAGPPVPASSRLPAEGWSREPKELPSNPHVSPHSVHSILPSVVWLRFPH